MQIASHDVLIVIDVQRDFCRGGALPVVDGEAVIGVIHRIAGCFEHILLTQDWHPPGHCSFASSYPGRQPNEVVSVGGREQHLWPDHCVQGTPGAEIHPSLHLPQAELILRKGFRKDIDSYSAFFENDRTTATGLAGYCRERGFTRTFLVGLAYDFCVGYSALDARRSGFDAVVIRDACRAIDVKGSLRSIEEQFAASGVEVIPGDRLNQE